MLLETPGQFPLHFLSTTLLKTYAGTESASGDYWAVPSTFPYEILIENIWEMLLEPPGQFPLQFLIKSLLKTYGNASGASWAGPLTFPYQIRIENIWKMLLEPPGQFPLHFHIKSLFKIHGKCFWSLPNYAPMAPVGGPWSHTAPCLELNKHWFSIVFFNCFALISSAKPSPGRSWEEEGGAVKS